MTHKEHQPVWDNVKQPKIYIMDRGQVVIKNIF